MNYKLTIQYDGTDFHGWQVQENVVSIQEVLTDAIRKITNEEINLIAAGRTDKGVHALGQVANFYFPEELETQKFCYSLNGLLPRSIVVRSCELVSDTFSARFSAISRTYVYLISSYRSPFMEKYSYFYRKKININFLNEKSQILLGEHNFRCFEKSKANKNNGICTVKAIKWKEKNNRVEFYIRANRFLRGMVRAIVGTLLEVEKYQKTDDYLISLINNHDRRAAGMSVPAKGLFLKNVRF